MPTKGDEQEDSRQAHGWSTTDATNDEPQRVQTQGSQGRERVQRRSSAVRHARLLERGPVPPLRPQPPERESLPQPGVGAVPRLQLGVSRGVSCQVPHGQV